MCFLALSHQYSIQQSFQLDKMGFELTALDIQPASLPTENQNNGLDLYPVHRSHSSATLSLSHTFRRFTAVLDRTIPD